MLEAVHVDESTKTITIELGFCYWQQKAKKSGIGQAWFPKSWSEKDIRRAGEHVAGLKSNRHSPDGKIMWGMYKGIRVGVIKTYGKIATVFPDYIQPTRRKKND